LCVCFWCMVKSNWSDKNREKNNSILSMKGIHLGWNVHNASCLLLVWYIVWSYNCCGKCHMLKSIFASCLWCLFVFYLAFLFWYVIFLWESIRQFIASFCLEVDPAIWLRPANVNTWSVYSVLICNKVSVEKNVYRAKLWVKRYKYRPSWS
jgi:hypothetical protein